MAFSKCYKVWLDGNLIYVTPDKINFSAPNKTETTRTADDSYITVSHRDDPFEFSFEFKSYMHKPIGGYYPFEQADDKGEVKDHKFWSDYFWNLKNSDDYRFKPIEFVVQRHNGDNTVEKMLLIDYSSVEDASDDDAFTWSITLRHYRMQDNQELDMGLNHHLVNVRQARGWSSGQGRMTVAQQPKQENTNALSESEKAKLNSTGDVPSWKG